MIHTLTLRRRAIGTLAVTALLTALVARRRQRPRSAGRPSVAPPPRRWRRSASATSRASPATRPPRATCSASTTSTAPSTSPPAAPATSTASRPAASSTSRPGSSSCGPRPRPRAASRSPSAPATSSAPPRWSAPRSTTSRRSRLMDEAVGLDISSVGNHEFDEGVAELLRMQHGGCHPTDGCQDGDGFAGAEFRYLAANVDLQEHRPADPAAVRRPVLRRRAGRLRRHDAGGHAEHRQPGRHHVGRLPRRDRRPPTCGAACCG